MTIVGWLPAPVEELFGPDTTAEESYGVLTVDVPPSSWTAALETARTTLACTYFDWLSAVDEPGTGFRVAAHVAALGSPVRRLLVRTTVPHEDAVLPTAVSVYAGAAWHERETHEMFGVRFEGHPGLEHLLLPESFEGHPLRKDFVLAARVAKAWPGAKEPGESDHGGPKRRQMLPPGVPDPNEWGPLKGQLPPAPARGAARAGAERPVRAAGERAGERPVRRTRTASQGSASQTAVPDSGTGAAADASAPAPAPAPAGTAGPRRSRSAADGSASQQGTAGRAGGPRRSRSAGEGSASQRADAGTDMAPGTPPTASTPTATERETSAAPPSEKPASGSGDGAGVGTGTGAEGASGSGAVPDGESASGAGSAPAGESASAPAAPADERATPSAAGRRAPRSADAPWHHARPAFDAPEPDRPDEDAEHRGSTQASAPAQDSGPSRGSEPAQDSGSTRGSGPAQPPESALPSESSEPAESAESSEPAGSSESAGPSRPAGSSESAGASRPAGSSEASERGEGLEASEGTGSVDRPDTDQTPQDPSGGTQ